MSGKACWTTATGTVVLVLASDVHIVNEIGEHERPNRTRDSVVEHHVCSHVGCPKKLINFQRQQPSMANSSRKQHWKAKRRYFGRGECPHKVSNCTSQRCSDNRSISPNDAPTCKGDERFRKGIQRSLQRCIPYVSSTWHVAWSWYMDWRMQCQALQP